MGFRFDIYIGSDNGSRRIQEDYLSRVLDWADSEFPEGYTVVRGRGCYEGVQEDSLVLNVLSDYDVDLREPLEELKRSLGQDSVLYSKQVVDVTLV